MGLRLKKIRIAVFERAQGWCECGCGRSITFESGRLDHFFGRARVEESVSNCWALHLHCDELKTVNRPSSIYWFRLFRDHCRRQRYREEFDRAETKIAYLKAKGMAA